jgi:hypothetical protein
MWCSSQLGNGRACHVGGRANNPLFPEQHSNHRNPKDGLVDNWLHNHNDNNTAILRDRTVEMLTESTASTKNIADNGPAATKQTKQLPGSLKVHRAQTTLQTTDLLQPSKPNSYQVTLPQQTPSPTAPINITHIHSENTTYTGQSNYIPHRKHGLILKQLMASRSSSTYGPQQIVVEAVI